MSTALGRRPGRGLARSHRAHLSFACLAALAALALPAVALASTFTQPPAVQCELPSTAVVAGTPFEVTGTTTTSERVGLLARKDTGETREASVATLNGTWRAVILFGAEDAGQWTVDLVVDGADCVSPLTVALPAGIVAPPARTPIDEAVAEPPPSGVDRSTVLTAAAVAGGAAVVGSWLVLAVVAAARIAGARPLERRGLRPIVQAATFVGVLGGFFTVGLVVYVGSHFNDSLRSDEAAVLDLGMWGVVIAGSAVGAIAARRVRNAS